jgi:hypothetical protein
VLEGKYSKKLAETIMPGMNFSRFQTLAICIFFLFMTLKDPPENLLKVIRFIILIYGPLWVFFKCRPNCLDAPCIFFKAMGRYKALPKEEQDVVLPIFEGGLYWLHMENLLLSMLGDLDKDVREKAVKTILEICHSPPHPQKKPKHGKGANKTIRLFNMPKPVYGAPSYDYSIYMVKEDRFEPPWMRDYSRWRPTKIEKNSHDAKPKRTFHRQFMQIPFPFIAVYFQLRPRTSRITFFNCQSVCLLVVHIYI